MLEGGPHRITVYLNALRTVVCTVLVRSVCSSLRSMLPDGHRIGKPGKSAGPCIPRLKPGAFWPLLCKESRKRHGVVPHTSLSCVAVLAAVWWTGALRLNEAYYTRSSGTGRGPRSM